jgi:hypothetical protein
MERRYRMPFRFKEMSTIIRRVKSEARPSLTSTAENHPKTCPPARANRGHPGNLSTVVCEQFVTNSGLLSRNILGLLLGSQNDLQPNLNCA